MSDDREMLELAAKAHGNLLFVEGCGWIHILPDGSRGAWWHPREDDSDAFRLMAKLELNVSHRTTEVDVSKGSVSASEYVPTYRNREEAARRATVRAAAEIGRRMKG